VIQDCVDDLFSVHCVVVAPLLLHVACVLRVIYAKRKAIRVTRKALVLCTHRRAFHLRCSTIVGHVAIKAATFDMRVACGCVASFGLTI